MIQSSAGMQGSEMKKRNKKKRIKSRRTGKGYRVCAALAAIACLLFSGGWTVHANVDPTWEAEVTADPVPILPEQTPEETPVEDIVPEAVAEPEQSFSTPGNGDLGDEIPDSSGKDFYTIHTKNNNTFYLVIDHSGNTENVYMLSLIDEDDLSEFLEQTGNEEEEKEKKQAEVPVVVIPETPAPTATPVPLPSVSQMPEPEQQGIPVNMSIWILAAGAAVFVLLYYFKIYRPEHAEEDDDSEGMELGDGLPTENEEEE